MSNGDLLETFLTLPEITNSLVSPDRKWVAWTWVRTDPTSQVYVAPTDGSAAPLRLSNSPENVVLVSWTPDSRAVLVAQDHDGDERLQLFQIDLTRSGEMQPLTEASPSYFLRGGDLHPNGRWLFYAANFDIDTGQEIEATWVYRHDLVTGERRVLARPSKAGYSRPRLNRQGTLVLYDRKGEHPSGNQVWLVDVEGQHDREILNFGAEVKVTGSWMADGRRVLVLAETGTHRKLGIWEDGTLLWLIDDPHRNLENVFAPVGGDPHSNQVVLVEIKETRVQASILDVVSGLELVLPEVRGNLLPLAPVSDKEWVGQFYSAVQPTDLVRFAIDVTIPLWHESFTSLTQLWERLDKLGVRSRDLAPAEDFRWTSVDGLEIQGWLYRAGNSRGTIIFIHGGPTAHSQDRFNSQVQYFVRQGFNVLSPNYRGSTGFNLAYQESIKEDGWGGREQADIATGIEALIKAGVAQPGKVGVTGTSYGGYSSWCLITRYPPELVAASAPICGMTDLVVDYETTRPDLRPYSEEMLGGRPDQIPDKYRERSPLHFVQNIRGKLMIIQGLQDPNVTPQNVQVVREALDQAGIKYELLTFEDEGHGISRPKNQKVLFQRLVEFFEAAFH